MLHFITNANGTVQYESLLEQIVGIACIYANDLATLRQAITVMGGGNVVSFVHQPQAWPPSWCLWQQGNTFVMHIAGTTNSSQIARHIIGIFPTNDSVLFGQIHAFFYTIYTQLKTALLAVLPQDLAFNNLIFSGHSFGASLAWLLASYFKNRRIPNSVHYLGFAPAKSVTTDYSGIRPDSCVGIHNVGDMVGYLPPQYSSYVVGAVVPGASFAIPTNWSHRGDNYTMDENGNLTLQPNSYWDNLYDPGIITTVSQHHLCGIYQSRVETGFRAI